MNRSFTLISSKTVLPDVIVTLLWEKFWIVRLWILLVARKSAVTVSTVNDQLWSLYTLPIIAIAFKWTNVSIDSICHDGNKVHSGNKLTLKRRLCNVWFFLFLYFAMHQQPSGMRACLIYKYYSIFTSLEKLLRLMDRYRYILKNKTGQPLINPGGNKCDMYYNSFSLLFN